MIWIGLVLLLLPARPGAAEIKALVDPSRAVREAAVARLAAMDCPVEDLLRLLDEADGRIRSGACEALALRGEPSAIPSLLLEGSAEAAQACVRIAESARLELPSIARLATPAMGQQLRRAHAAAVHDQVGRVSGSLQLARPQIHRAFHSGGVWSEQLLRAIASDPDQSIEKRAHALHAAQLMEGRALQDLLIRLLHDPQARVRGTALTLLWRLHTPEGNRELVKLLDIAERLPSAQASLLVSSAEQGAKPSAKGIEFLATRVARGSATVSASAASTLMEYDRARALALLTARVADEIRRSDGPQVALFFLRCGTPTPELREQAQRTRDPLARLTAFPDPKSAGTTLDAHLDPSKGPTEWIRIRVVTALLGRRKATWEQRARFVRGLLRSDTANWRAGGLAVLEGAPAAVFASFRTDAMGSLDDPTEAVRVRAAVLLLPDPRAERVLWSALYDGDLRTAWTAGPALDPELGRDTPVAERRRLARDALARLDRR